MKTSNFLSSLLSPLSFLLFSLFISVPGLWAQEQADKSGLTVSLGASMGLLNGQGEEIIYWDSVSDRKLSQLLWDFKPLAYAGFDVNINWQKPESRWGFFTVETFRFGFPGKSGVIQDSDWRGVNYPDWLTDYSVSDNRTDSAILIDANIGASFRLSPLFLLKAYLAYNFIHFSWTASGGSFLYPPTANNPYGHGYYPNSIDAGKYTQTWHIISPALAFYGKFNRYFDIELSFAISPVVFAAAVDNHLLRSLDILSDMKYGLFIEPKLVFSYTPTAKNFPSLSLSVSYRNMSGTRGNGEYVYYATPENNALEINRGGAGYHAFDVGLTAKFNVNLF